MRKLILFLLMATPQVAVLAQTNAIVAEIRQLGTGTCSSDSGMTTLTYLIRDEILRVDLKGPNANSSIIFQPSSDKIWVLYHFEKIFFTMTSQEMDSFNRQVEYVGVEMQKKYENMDEKDKEQTGALWENGNPFTKKDYHYEKMKKSDSLVSQLLCDKYRAEIKKKQVRFAYLNDLKTTGIKDEDLAILNKFSGFIGNGITTLTGNMDLTAFRKWKEGGYPIFVKTTENNMVCHEAWTQFIYRTYIEDQAFTIPFDFGKRPNPLGNQ